MFIVDVFAYAGDKSLAAKRTNHGTLWGRTKKTRRKRRKSYNRSVLVNAFTFGFSESVAPGFSLHLSIAVLVCAWHRTCSSHLCDSIDSKKKVGHVFLVLVVYPFKWNENEFQWVRFYFPVISLLFVLFVLIRGYSNLCFRWQAYLLSLNNFITLIHKGKKTWWAI